MKPRQVRILSTHVPLYIRNGYMLELILADDTSVMVDRHTIPAIQEWSSKIGLPLSFGADPYTHMAWVSASDEAKLVYMMERARHDAAR